jgi:hypothetical protein
MEVGRYATEGKISDILLTEFHNYLLNIYNRFKEYDPYFITFFDDGFCQQNRSVLSSYKSGNSMDNVQLEIDHIQLFRAIKKYYYDQIYRRYNNKKAASTYYLKQYEADLIPHLCISNNLFDAQDSDVGNFILSKDKDLLQTLKFKNTFQVISNYLPSKRTQFSRIFQDDDCIEYLYPNFRKGILSARHIPLILAITGDKSDGIDGIKGIGPAKAVKLIQNNNIPPTISELKAYQQKLTQNNKTPTIFESETRQHLPTIVSENLDLIIQNLKMIDFEEQLKRIPHDILEAI